MPYTIQQADNQFCVFKRNADGSLEKVPGGCHEDRAQAVNHLRALYANVEKSMNNLEIKTEADAVRLGLPTFKFVAEMKAVKAADGLKRVHLVASSDATDLVGDVMSEKALQRMKETAIGKTMFLNHDTTVPESVFGVIEDTALISRTVQVATMGEQKTFSELPLVCLEYDVIVEESNPRAVKTWEIINNGKVQLGASVTIAVLDKTRTKDGRNILEDVYHLETSVVGVPCNQTAWLDRVRTKSFALMAKRVARRPVRNQIELHISDGQEVDDETLKSLVAVKETTTMELAKGLETASESLATLNNSLTELVSKVGARNSRSDLQMLGTCHEGSHTLHKTLLSLGVECKAFPADEAETSDEDSNEDENSELDVEEKAAEQAVAANQITELETKITELEKQLSDSQITIKTITHDCALWKARYKTAVTLAERYANLPAERPGLSVS